MKITVNSIPMEAIGCVQRHDGRVTIVLHSTNSFAELVATFDGIESLTAERGAKTSTYTGKATLVAICRNAGSDFATVTLAGLDPVEEVQE